MNTPSVPDAAAADSSADVRMLITIAWVAGPTVIFVGWFLMCLIAGSQRPLAGQDGTPIALLFVFALITSVPLIIISLVGGLTTMLSTSAKTQRTLNLFALLWSAIVFAIYFGLFGIVGTVTENGFPVTPKTVLALIPIALITLVLPIALFLIARGRIAQGAVPSPADSPAATPAPAAVADSSYGYDI